jgi:repressor LexA
MPIDAVADNETLEVPSWMLGSGETFVLRAKGNSMVGDGILDGDYLVVRRQPTAENGDTVIALVDGAATVKRFHRRGRAVELRPANPAMAPILVEAGRDLRLEGVVVGVLRSFR